MVLSEASGAHFTDAEGMHALDYHATFGPLILGHIYPRVNALDVTIETYFPGGSNVVGRWRGVATGPSVAFVGHLGTIHTPHAVPRRTADAVHGHGADDMKGSMAAMIAAIDALRMAGY